MVFKPAVLHGLTAIGLIFSTSANATWTIVAVEPVTREVGSAGASCTPFVMGVTEVVPGKGAIVVQARSSVSAREKAMQMLIAGRSAQDIVTAIKDPAFDPDVQQYGAAVLAGDGGNPTADAFTGDNTRGAKGHYVGAGVAVQGNILVSDLVLKATLDAYNGAAANGQPLSDRLLLALEAGAMKGGDSRCAGKTAQSAFLMVAHPDNAMRQPSSMFRSSALNDGINPVTLIRQDYDARKRAFAIP